MINNSITVVIPAHNSEKTISKCLRAIKRQSFPPMEVIVVDDRSTDKTVEIAQELAVVIPNTHRKGAGGARNTGGYVARGNIIAFTDSDCIPPKDWLKNIASVFSDAEVGAVGGGYSSGIDESFWQRFCHEELKFRRRRRDGQAESLVSNNLACRKSIFLEEQGFPEQYPVCEDMLFSHRISEKSKVIWLNNNGVQHHFVDSLKAFLGHQYFFGAESTRFFLQNPKTLTADNHQGKTLHVVIILALLSALTLLLAGGSLLSGKFELGGIFLLILLLLISTHFLLYLRFIRHLAEIKLPNIPKAYGVSLLRDLFCGISIFDGIYRAIAHRK